MADFWKSNPRKFCDFCKCWIADNKPSIDFHEKGKNHQQNVKRKISEVKKKAVQKRKDNEDFSKQFAAMETAALKAVKKDIKNDPGIVGEDDLQSLVKDSNKNTQEKLGAANSSDDKSHPIWQECQTPQGHTYYYNKKTGESIWQKPKELMKDNDKSKSKEKKNFDKKKPSKQQDGSKNAAKEDANQNYNNSHVVETERHPLLGAWTVVETPTTEESPPSPDDETEQAQNNADTEVQDPSKNDSTDPELVNPESRKRLAVFKEKTLKSDQMVNSEETISFKKRKVKCNRNARKRCGED